MVGKWMFGVYNTLNYDYDQKTEMLAVPRGALWIRSHAGRAAQPYRMRLTSLGGSGLPLAPLDCTLRVTADPGGPYEGGKGIAGVGYGNVIAALWGG